jgi:septal ring factor EnvC (AmiA/AmiB activator)
VRNLLFLKIKADSSRDAVRRNDHGKNLSSTPICAILRSSSQSSGKEVIMSLRLAEEVPAQVPADDFLALEEKVYRTIEMYKAAREARAAAERDAQRLRAQLEEREEEFEAMRRDMIRLRKEREEVRSRVEKMLKQIDDLAAEQAVS